jgi:hypothetical protein
MNTQDYKELNAIQLLLEFYNITYSFMIENNKTCFMLHNPPFITEDLHELSREVLKRTNKEGDE